MLKNTRHREVQIGGRVTIFIPIPDPFAEFESIDWNPVEPYVELSPLTLNKELRGETGVRTVLAGKMVQGEFVWAAMMVTEGDEGRPRDVEWHPILEYLIPLLIQEGVLGKSSRVYESCVEGWVCTDPCGR